MNITKLTLALSLFLCFSQVKTMELQSMETTLSKVMPLTGRAFFNDTFVKKSAMEELREYVTPKNLKIVGYHWENVFSQSHLQYIKNEIETVSRLVHILLKLNVPAFDIAQIITDKNMQLFNAKTIQELINSSNKKKAIISIITKIITINNIYIIDPEIIKIIIDIDPKTVHHFASCINETNLHQVCGGIIYLIIECDQKYATTFINLSNSIYGDIEVPRIYRELFTSLLLIAQDSSPKKVDMLKLLIKSDSYFSKYLHDDYFSRLYNITKYCNPLDMRWDSIFDYNVINRCCDAHPQFIETLASHINSKNIHKIQPDLLKILLNKDPLLAKKFAKFITWDHVPKINASEANELIFDLKCTIIDGSLNIPKTKLINILEEFGAEENDRQYVPTIKISDTKIDFTKEEICEEEDNYQKYIPARSIKLIIKTDEKCRDIIRNNLKYTTEEDDCTHLINKKWHMLPSEYKKLLKIKTNETLRSKL